jgi:hypothetical protein
MDSDWLWQGVVTNLVSDALVLGAIFAWRRRQAIMDKLGLSPKPIVVPLKPLNITSKIGQASITAGSELTVRANVYSTVGRSLTALWNTKEPTQPLKWRLLDEGLEVLSLLPRYW